MVRVGAELAFLLERVGELQTAEAIADTVIQQAIVSGPPSVDARAAALLGAWLGTDQTRFDEADIYARVALSLAGRVPADRALEAYVLGRVGWLRLQEGRFEDSADALTRAVELYRKSRGTRNPDVATALSAVGSLHLTRGDYDAAWKAYGEALEIARDTVGDQHPMYAAILAFGLAKSQWELGQRATALATAEAAVQAYGQAGDGQSAGLAEVTEWVSKRRAN